MLSFPPCKINLGLHILSKRPDGYHNLETCFYPLPLVDILEILPAPDLQFTTSGLSIPESATGNLCLQAYQLLRTDFSLPHIRIHLHKAIPTGAGLGGGSSDAAHTLRLLNQLFSLRLTKSQLANFAQRLGSDCAFFVQDEPKLGLGRGEQVESLAFSLRNKFLVLLHPDIHVSTADAYRGVSPKRPSTSLKEILETAPPATWKGLLTNDFEESVFAEHPSLAASKEKLYQVGAFYASMSGSGSSLFGLFDKAPASLPANLPVIWSGYLHH